MTHAGKEIRFGLIGFFGRVERFFQLLRLLFEFLLQLALFSDIGDIDHYRIGDRDSILQLVCEGGGELYPFRTIFYRHLHDRFVTVGIIGYCIIYFLSQYVPGFFMLFKIYVRAVLEKSFILFFGITYQVIIEIVCP